MYILRICYRHCCRVNCAVIVEKYHIVKRKAYINSKASIHCRVVVNSTICICWGYVVNIGVELFVQSLWKISHCVKEAYINSKVSILGSVIVNKYLMYMLRICCKHWCSVNCAVIVEKYHIVKRKAYINSKASILWRVVLNSTICICCEYAVDIVAESIVQ